ncbi:HD domain-containing protein [Thermogemmatispora sp.]|uniref:HD domain-containing protein n=1 Tax=Thermogemmatispora sp. TaxID=1968838 RepID=UPI0035E400E2
MSGRDALALLDQARLLSLIRLAEELLAPLGVRWLHVQGVARVARSISPAFSADAAWHLIAAAYLHDVGYAPALWQTGFHPLDGALFLRQQGDERLACLVAHHSEARFEARLRGLEDLLLRFPRERSIVADALTFCDLTTSPLGTPVSFQERAREVAVRYGPDHVVTQALRQALPTMSLAIARTRRWLRRHGIDPDHLFSG